MTSYNVNLKWNKFFNYNAKFFDYFLFLSDAGERELIVSDPIFIETSNHTDNPDYENDNDLFCPASPTTVPTSAIKSRSNSGNF